MNNIGTEITTFSYYSFLIVDDEEFVRTLLAKILNTLGAQNVFLANGGASALDFLDSTIPDIILCDLNMAEMDGVEFLRHAVNKGFKGGIGIVSGEDPRIMQTAAQLGEAHKLNILGALSKPVTPSALKDLLTKYTQTNDSRPRTTDPKITANELEEALNNNSLTVYFQPKVSVATREVIGVEALIRWIDDEKGFISPEHIIFIAEENNLIDKLTDYVIKLAMQQGAQWLMQGLSFKVAINLSVNNLSRLDLPEFIIQAAHEAGMDPTLVILEVTESRLMEDITKPLETLIRMRIKGLQLSIDDFGTGYSSMEQLQRIPFTELKIDRAFVHGAHLDNTARSILESSVTLAKNLGMSIVAEGVEDQHDWELISSLGVDTVQGYFIAKPMPAHEFDTWFSTYNKSL